jgi:hypothetical protein
MGMNDPNRLVDGFRFSRLNNISRFNPKIPVQSSNPRFKFGAGLPFGDPELTILPPIRATPWPWE